MYLKLPMKQRHCSQKPIWHLMIENSVDFNMQASVRVGDLLLSEEDEFQVKMKTPKPTSFKGKSNLICDSDFLWLEVLKVIFFAIGDPVVQVTVNVTKMLKHEDHETFSSPENLCLIEVTWMQLWQRCTKGIAAEIHKFQKSIKIMRHSRLQRISVPLRWYECM